MDLQQRINAFAKLGDFLSQFNTSSIEQKEGAEAGLFKQTEQEHGIEEVMDWKLMDLAKPALEEGKKVFAELKIINTDDGVRPYRFT